MARIVDQSHIGALGVADEPLDIVFEVGPVVVQRAVDIEAEIAQQVVHRPRIILGVRQVVKRLAVIVALADDQRHAVQLGAKRGRRAKQQHRGKSGKKRMSGSHW